jgi:serine protease Do
MLSFTVDAMAPPENPPRNEQVITGNNILSGIEVGNINPAVELELGLRAGEQGVVVLSVPKRSTAHRFLSAGDILLQIGGAEIKTPADVQKAIERSQDGLTLVFSRFGRVSKIYIR